MTSQLDSGAAPAPATQWRDRKRYLWLFALVPPTALFVLLPVIWGLNQLGWTAASQVFFWVGPFLIYVLLPALDIRFGRDGQNPPDEVMEYLVDLLFNRDPVLRQHAHKRLTRTVLFYMYWNCDIGEVGDASSDQTLSP